MAKQLKTKYIENLAVTEAKIANNAVTENKINAAAVTSAKLAASAKQSTLEAKLIPARNAVANFTTSAAGSDDISTEIGGLGISTAQTDLVTGKGGYAGAVSGATDPLKVIIRAQGTDNGIEDGNSDEIYGVLTEDTGVWTLTYKKADGTGYTFSEAIAIDFYIVRIYDLYDLDPKALLYQSVSGVVDATNASSIAQHLNGDVNKHDASEIDFEDTATSAKNLSAGSVEAAITALDDAIGVLIQGANYTASDSTIIADHLAAIDTALSTAGSTSFSDAEFEIANESDGTKKLIFDASPVTTGQTRTISGADRNVDLANITLRNSEVLTLTSADIANKYKDLTVSASVVNANSAILTPLGGIIQEYTVDFTIITDSTYIRRVNWNGLGLDGVLEVGEKIAVNYEING